VRPVLELRLRSSLNFFRRSAGLGALVLLFGLARPSWGQQTCNSPQVYMGPDVGCAVPPSCTGLCQQQVSCSGTGTTSLTGTVYAPNGTDPVPNVLVYVPNAPVQPFATGVSFPPVSGSPLVGTVTAADGTFTLNNMPVGGNIPLVLQIGKWRRQIVIPNVAQCVTTTAASASTRLPKNRAEGDLPKIAVVTGAVDAEECTLRKIGIADTEFTDPAPFSASPGRVNLYLEGAAQGAQIDDTTVAATLWGNTPSTLNGYDVLLLANQGWPDGTPTATYQQELVGFANAGGRVLATHYSYDWLTKVSNNAYVPFPGVANWAVSGSQFANDAQTGLVNTSFARGQQMAQWLKLVGASTTQGQIPLAGLRDDVASVNPPSVAFLNVQDATLGNVPVQFSFDMPLGVMAKNQMGRVLFSAFSNVAGTGVPTAPYTGMTFPNECTTGPMTAMEKLFEYNLFDTTGFLSSPLPAPTAAVYVGHSPAIFAPGDSADLLTIGVVTSGSSALSAGLTVTPSLPAGLTPVSVSASGAGNWSCALSPLSCSTQDAASSISATISVTVSVAGNATGPLAVSATASGGGLASSATGSDSIPVTQPQAVTFITNAPSVAAFGTSFTVAAQASSGLPVTYESSGSCTNSDATFTMTSGAGVCSVTASQAGNGSYSAAESTETVNAAPAPALVVAGSALNPSVVGQPVTLVATVLPQPLLQGTGTITFKDGTTVLGTAALNAFDNASITASTLSPGTHTITASYSGDTSTAGSVSSILVQTVQSSASISGLPIGTIDRAVDATTGSTTIAQSDNLLVSGWAADPHDGAPVSSVTILIDGNQVGTATLGGSRPDVATHFNLPGYQNSGWSFRYAASGLSFGTHTVSAVVYDSLGLSATLQTLPITVAATSTGPPFGSLDRAVDATTGSTTIAQSDNLLVSGWAADPHDGAPVSSVTILIDGNQVGTATLGGSRPDVAAHLNLPGYQNSGWSFTYPASGLSLGTHTVTAMAHDSLSLSRTLQTVTITVQ
jgi:hypothetical protein